MKRIAGVFFLGIVGIINPLRAQVAERVIAKYKSLPKLSYTINTKQKDLFSDQVFFDTLNMAFAKGDQKSVFRYRGKGQEDIFDGSKLFKLELASQTYRIASDGKQAIHYQASLDNLLDGLGKSLRKKTIVSQTADSLVQGKPYFKIRIKELDSLKNGKQVYNYATWLIDKQTYLPYYYRQDQMGFIDGTQIYVALFYEYHFENYQTKSKAIDGLAQLMLPENFSLEKPKVHVPLLSKGTEMPDVELTDPKGNPTRLSALKGKVLLLNFTMNGCPHCVEAIETLNQLIAKYKGKDFEVVGINPFDDQASISKFNQKLGISHGTYTTSKAKTEKYNLEGYPTFYLIDKNGKIVQGFLGFSNEIGIKLTQAVDGLMR